MKCIFKVDNCAKPSESLRICWGKKGEQLSLVFFSGLLVFSTLLTRFMTIKELPKSTLVKKAKKSAKLFFCLSGWRCSNFWRPNFHDLVLDFFAYNRASDDDRVSKKGEKSLVKKKRPSREYELTRTKYTLRAFLALLLLYTSLQKGEDDALFGGNFPISESIFLSETIMEETSVFVKWKKSWLISLPLLFSLSLPKRGSRKEET